MSRVREVKGILWLVNETGPVAKIMFDTESRKVKNLKLNKDDYERAFKISAYLLRLIAKSGREYGELGHVKDNIIYARHGSIIVILNADTEIANSPYIYGYLRIILRKIRENMDGVIIVDEITDILRKMVMNMPKPLSTVKPKYELF